MLGYYLFDVNINNPLEESNYLINWNNKLNISDVDMHILEEDLNEDNLKHTSMIKLKSSKIVWLYINTL